MCTNESPVRKKGKILECFMFQRDQSELHVPAFGKELIWCAFMGLRIEICLSEGFCGSHLPEAKAWVTVLLLCLVPTYLCTCDVF